MTPTERWRAVKSDARFYVRQVLSKEADAAERDLVHARKRLDVAEAARLGGHRRGMPRRAGGHRRSHGTLNAPSRGMPVVSDEMRRLRALAILDPKKAAAEIRKAIERAGSRELAAKELGVGERSLYRLLVELKIEAPKGRPGPLPKKA